MSFDAALEELALAPSRLAAAIQRAAEQGLVDGNRLELRVIRDVLEHLKDAELVTSVRCRLMLVEDVPDLPPFDAKRWRERLSYPEGDTATAVQYFQVLRDNNVRLLQRVKVPARKHEGWHPEYGSITLEGLVVHSAAETARQLKRIFECLSEVHLSDVTDDER